MNTVRNALKNLFSKLPTGGAGGGGGGGAAAADALGKIVVLGATLGVGAYGALHAMYTVNPGHLGIVYNRSSGIDEHFVAREGLNFLVPWLMRPIVFDVRTRPKLVTSTSGSKDLQMVEIGVRVLFKPDTNQLPSIYRRLGQDYEERVLPSIVNEVTKAVIAQFNASELLTKRDVVSKQIRDMLMHRAQDFHILMEDVAITHLAFSKEYTAAVEAKQVAKQEAERAKYIVEKALQEKRTIVIKAQGEAQSAALIGTAIKKNPAFLELRRIETGREIATSVANGEAKVYLNSDALLLNNLASKSGVPTPNK